MNGVRINLLPREYAERTRQRRIAGATAALVVAFVVLLAGLYVVKLGDVRAAEEERDAAQAEVARLQAELAQLEQFRQLAAELENRNALLADAMETEISWARVFNDLALSFPASSSLRTMAATVTDASAAGPADPPPTQPNADATEPAAVPDASDAAGAPPVAVADVVFTGYSVERYAPGVETVLIQFDDIRSFFNSYLAVAEVEEIGETPVTGFDGSVQLNREAYTNRYDDGLPGGIPQ